MSFMRHRLRSGLTNTQEITGLLTKIAGLYAQSHRRVVFEKGSSRWNAADLNAVVINPTAGSDQIQFQTAPFSNVAGTLVLQDLTFTGAAGNASDNAVTIAYTTGGTAGSEIVTKTGTAVSIKIQSGVSTATQVRAAFNTARQASATLEELLYKAAAGSAGSGQTIAYTGGATAGSEVVSFVGQAISVQIESGVSTCTQVIAALASAIGSDTPAGIAALLPAAPTQASGSGSDTVTTHAPVAFTGGSDSGTSLASCAVSGTGSNPQTAPVAATNLSGGVTAAPVQKYELADIEIIRRLRVKKWLIRILDMASGS
jgi:hypothetical protein